MVNLPKIRFFPGKNCGTSYVDSLGYQVLYFDGDGVLKLIEQYITVL